MLYDISVAHAILKINKSIKMTNGFYGIFLKKKIIWVPRPKNSSRDKITV